jgi:hypothetical protein
VEKTFVLPAISLKRNELKNNKKIQSIQILHNFHLHGVLLAGRKQRN